MNKTIVITGGTGFLGSHLIHRLVHNNINIIVLVRSASNCWRIEKLLDRITLFNTSEDQLDKLFDNNKIDTIIHCATNYGRLEKNPIAVLEANLLLPLKLLHLGSKYDVSCFINTGTVLDKKLNYYSLAKSQMREWLEMYSVEMTCINIALQQFYGPQDDETKFITYIIRSLLNNVKKIDLTKGEQKRDFIYIDDVIDAFEIIINSSPKKQKGLYHYEVGTGQTLEICNIVKILKKLTGNKKTLFDFGAIPYRNNELMVSYANLSAISSLGWTPKISLMDGLQKTIQSERNRKSL